MPRTGHRPFTPNVFLDVRKKRAKKMLTGFAMFLAIYFALCALLARNYLHPPRWTSVRPVGLAEVSIPTKAGPDPAYATPGLAAGHPSKVVFVLAHGYGGDRAGFASLSAGLLARGYDSVAPSMPGQDASPDSTVGFGVKESQAIVDTVRWTRDQAGANHVRVVVLGISMGGAAAWLASEIDPTVDGVISEGAYANFDEAMRGWFDRKAPGASIYLRPVVWFATAMSGLRPEAIRPMDAATKWRGRPALVIQGAEDNLIPRSHADRLANAAGCELWVVPGAEHAQCSNASGTEYFERLDKFARALR